MLSKYAKWVYNDLLEVDQNEINMVVGKLSHCRGTIFTCGNGGSSSSASHFTQDLMKACNKKSICLSDNVPLITAVSNDLDYSEIFSKQLHLLYQPEDILFIVSGSGNSKNLVEVAWMSHGRIPVIGLLGNDGGLVKRWCDFSIIVPEIDMRVIESAHSTILHYIIDRVYHEPIRPI